MRSLCLTAALAAMSLLALSCAPNRPPKMAPAGAAEVPGTMGLAIIVDGFGAERFDQLQREGKLPNITKYLVNRGVTVRQALDVLPTITYCNNTSMLTGMLPGRHGIMGNKWFDRQSLVLQDYTELRAYRRVDGDFTDQTIFERLHEDLTCSILLPVRRGASRNYDNWATAGLSWFFGQQKNVNNLTTARFEKISDLACLAGRWPKFTLAYFATPDTIGHANGTDTGAYDDMIFDVDQQVGNICQSLEQSCLLDKTVIVLVSDHGMMDTPNHKDMRAFFQQDLGIPSHERIYDDSNTMEERVKYFDPVRCVVVVNGDRRCDIHLRTGEHWYQRPGDDDIESFVRKFASNCDLFRGQNVPDLSKMLLDMPCTDLLTIRRGPQAVEVASRRGRGLIQRTRDGEKTYSYRVTSGSDPLGYDAFPEAAVLCDGKSHDEAAWMKATLATCRPNAVPGLMELNDSPRCGDVTMFAAEGWDFGRSNKGGHGGLTRTEMFVPFVWAGPGLPAGACVTDSARVVDLMPTMLDLIDRADRIPPGLDGRSLARLLRSAGRTTTAPAR